MESVCREHRKRFYRLAFRTQNARPLHRGIVALRIFYRLVIPPGDLRVIFCGTPLKRFIVVVHIDFSGAPQPLGNRHVHRLVPFHQERDFILPIPVSRHISDFKRTPALPAFPQERCVCINTCAVHAPSHRTQHRLESKRRGRSRQGGRLLQGGACVESEYRLCKFPAHFVKCRVRAPSAALKVGHQLFNIFSSLFPEFISDRVLNTVVDPVRAGHRPAVNRIEITDGRRQSIISRGVFHVAWNNACDIFQQDRIGGVFALLQHTHSLERSVFHKALKFSFCERLVRRDRHIVLNIRDLISKHIKRCAVDRLFAVCVKKLIRQICELLFLRSHAVCNCFYLLRRELYDCLVRVRVRNLSLLI